MRRAGQGRAHRQGSGVTERFDGRVGPTVDPLAEEFTLLPREGDVVHDFVGAVHPTDHPDAPHPDRAAAEELDP